MKRMNKKYLAVLLAACVALAGWHVDVKNADAATFRILIRTVYF